MPPEAFSVEDLERRFGWIHPEMLDAAGERLDAVRERCAGVAEYLVRSAPPGRELSLALTSLEETMMWTLAAIARDPESRPARASIR